MQGTLPVPRDSHSCTTVGDRLFIFGGTDGNVPLKDLHILDTCESFLHFHFHLFNVELHKLISVYSFVYVRLFYNIVSHKYMDGTICKRGGTGSTRRPQCCTYWETTFYLWGMWEVFRYSC